MSPPLLPSDNPGKKNFPASHCMGAREATIMARVFTIGTPSLTHRGHDGLQKITGTAKKTLNARLQIIGAFLPIITLKQKTKTERLRLKHEPIFFDWLNYENVIK